jgi:hypothetical protein
MRLAASGNARSLPTHKNKQSALCASICIMEITHERESLSFKRRERLRFVFLRHLTRRAEATLQ